MIRLAAIVITFIMMCWIQPALGQAVNDDPPFVKLTIDLSALSEDAMLQDVEISLDNTLINAEALKTDTSMIIPVSTGKHILKAFIPGHGADRVKFEVNPEATGEFTLTLAPYLIGLAGHVDNYTLEWVHEVKPNYLPTSGPTNLKFTDKSGAFIPVTQVMDARLSTQN